MQNCSYTAIRDNAWLWTRVKASKPHSPATLARVEAENSATGGVFSCLPWACGRGASPDPLTPCRIPPPGEDFRPRLLRELDDRATQYSGAKCGFCISPDHLS